MTEPFDELVEERPERGQDPQLSGSPLPPSFNLSETSVPLASEASQGLSSAAVGDFPFEGQPPLRATVLGADGEAAGPSGGPEQLDAAATQPAPEVVAAAASAVSVRCARPTLAISLLNSGLVLIFVFLLSGEDFNAASFWRSFFRDAALNLDDLDRFGALTELTLRAGDQFWRVGASLLLHPGPFSLLLSVFMLIGAGRFVERFGGSLQVIFLFFAGGVFGNLCSLVLSSSELGPVVPVAAWNGGFALIGAQYALRRRGLFESLPEPPRSSTGFLGQLILVWMILLLHLEEQALDMRLMTAPLVGFCAAAMTGYVLMSRLPAWLDGDEPPSLAGGVVWTGLLIGVSWLMINLPSLAPKGAGFRFGRDDGSAYLSMRRRREPALGFSIEIPEAWSVRARKENLVRYGTQVMDTLTVFTRDRHAFDAADTLVGRYLHMTSRNRGDLGVADPLRIIEEGSLEHEIGQGYRASYIIERPSMYRRRTILQRCLYIVGEDRVFLLLIRQLAGDDRKTFWRGIIDSLRLEQDPEAEREDELQPDREGEPEEGAPGDEKK
jgi:membrane associated rhomboid family serine protease